MEHQGAAELQKYPNITVFLKEKHPKLWKLLEQAGLERALTPRGKEDGVTFLIPDEKYLKEIDKKLSSADAEEATEMLSSLILSGFYPTVRSMEGKTIVNRLNKRLVIKEIKPAAVHVDDGVIKVDPSFRPMSKVGTSVRGNMAVWLLSGKVEFKNVPSGLAMRKRDVPDKEHGKEHEDRKEGGAYDATLCDVYKKVMERKKKELAFPRGRWEMGRTNASTKVHCPVLVAVAKIMAGMKALGYTDQEEILMSVGSGTPTIDFVLLCCSGAFDCHKVCEAYEHGISGDSAVEVYKSFWRQNLSNDALVLNATGRKELNDDIGDMKEQVEQMMVRTASTEISNFYKIVHKNKGTFDGRPIFPGSVMKICGKDCVKLRCLDAVKFAMGADLYAMEESCVEDANKYCQEYFAMLSEMVTSDCELVDMSGVFEDPGVKNALARSVADENMIKLFRMSFMFPTGDESDQRTILGGDEHGHDMPPVHHDKMDRYEHSPVKMSSKNRSLFKHYVTSHGFSTVEDIVNSLK